MRKGNASHTATLPCYVQFVLDPASMRIALAAVALTLLVLSYFGVHRPTRSSYSGWWCISLVASAAYSALFIFDGTPAQEYTGPLGTGIGVAGAGFAWAAARALSGRTTPWWQLTLFPVFATIFAVFDNPRDDIWAGGEGLLLGMAVMFTLATVELWRAYRHLTDARAVDDVANGAESVRALAIAVTAISAYYWLRAAAMIAVGSDSQFFDEVAGTVPATLITLVALVVVTFTMTALVQLERTRALRVRATIDPLTGVINRSEFEARTADAFAHPESRFAVAIADLDRFKAVNDTHGHAAGDRVLVAFATAVRIALPGTDVIGRLGGEEFGLLLEVDNGINAIARIDEVRAACATFPAAVPGLSVTASFGVTMVHAGDTLALALRRADEALYQAKHQGRDRAILHGGG